MNPLSARLNAVTGSARAALRHAPLEVALGAVVSVVFSLSLRKAVTEEIWARTLLTVLLAFPLAFALSLLRMRGIIGAVARWGGSAAVLAASAAYVFARFDPEHAAEGWRAAMLLGISVLTLLLAVPLARAAAAGRERRLWCFVVALLGRAVVVGIYAALLYAAFAGAMAAVVSLFDLGDPEYLYGDLAGVVFFVLLPWVFAGGADVLAAAAEGEQWEAPRGLRLAGAYLALPVLALYLPLLYAYLLRVVVTGEMPKNLLSPLVLFAGYFGFLAAVLLAPLRDDAPTPAVARLLRVFPTLLLLLLPLPIWAVWVRRMDYGWTEFRYLRLMLLLGLLVLAVLGTVRLVRRRPPLLIAIPAVLLAVLLVSVVGPWSASAVSRRDQLARLRGALREQGMLRPDGTASGLFRTPGDIAGPRRTVPKAAYTRIEGSLMYLLEAHGPGVLRGIVPEEVRFKNVYAAREALAITGGCDRPTGVRIMRAANMLLSSGVRIPGVAGGTLIRLVALPDSSVVPAAAQVVAVRNGTRVSVRHGAPDAWRAELDLDALARRVLGRGDESCGPPSSRAPGRALAPSEALVPLRDTAGRLRGQLLITDLGVSEDNGPKAGPLTRSITQLEGFVALPDSAAR